MDYLLLQATNGAIIGIVYALIAVGVTIIFSILKIVNVAHGDLYVLGGYTAYYVITLLGAPCSLARPQRVEAGGRERLVEEVARVLVEERPRPGVEGRRLPARAPAGGVQVSFGPQA